MRKRSVPLFGKEGLGEILLDTPTQSPFSKGGKHLRRGDGNIGMIECIGFYGFFNF